MMTYRTEHDSMGEVKVPSSRYYGAQTQRSVNNFPIGVGLETMPEAIIRAFAILKKAVALTNLECNRKMDEKKARLICQVCDEILEGKRDRDFPLVVWQTGSGTQTNMNVNEVIANRGNFLASEKLLHPNDDVNMSQSSNDTFPTALHIAAVLMVTRNLLPALDSLITEFDDLEKRSQGIIKCGRTHLQDATPISFSQEISGWKASLAQDRKMISTALEPVRELALGGTAVGTGLNAPKGFDVKVAEKISSLTSAAFVTSSNKFHALTSQSEIVALHGSLKALAADMMKIANDIRWLASGPRNGLGEITIPENEPGSSIMPGKVNPTQCEAVTMVCVQVMGNDSAIGFASSQGNFELNVFLPVMAYNLLQSIRLLGDVCSSFAKRCVSGIKANQEKMKENLNRSLMLVTAISPQIGYENAAKVAKKALDEKLTLKQACTELGLLTDEQFDRLFHPEQMI